MKGIKAPVKQRRLVNPVNYRIFDYQDEWLGQQAELQGHGRKVLILRKLLDEAILATNGHAKKTGKRKAA